MLRLPKKKTPERKLAEMTGGLMTDCCELAIKYSIVSNAMAGRLLKPDSISAFAARVTGRFVKDAMTLIGSRGHVISQTKLSELIALAEEAVECEARLLGKWDDNAHIPEIKPEGVDKINEHLEAMGLGPLLKVEDGKVVAHGD